jgi:hypothetical protein
MKVGNKLGRPPKPESERLSKMVLVRLTLAEWTELKRLAAKVSESVSRLMRLGSFERARRLVRERSRRKRP